MKCEGSDHEAAESYCHFTLLYQSVEAGDLALTHTAIVAVHDAAVPLLILDRFVEMRGAIKTNPCRAPVLRKQKN